MRQAAVVLLAWLLGGCANAPAPAITELQVHDIIAGFGNEAQAGDQLTISYTGWLYDANARHGKGPQFAASPKKQPLVFRLGLNQVVQGLDDGLLGMRVGGRRTIMVPPALAYGATGSSDGRIPPNAALIFEVELLDVD